MTQLGKGLALDTFSKSQNQSLVFFFLNPRFHNTAYSFVKVFDFVQELTYERGLGLQGYLAQKRHPPPRTLQ